jgi:hypothetical protein
MFLPNLVVTTEGESFVFPFGKSSYRSVCAVLLPQDIALILTVAPTTDRPSLNPIRRLSQSVTSCLQKHSF